MLKNFYDDYDDDDDRCLDAVRWAM